MQLSQFFSGSSYSKNALIFKKQLFILILKKNEKISSEGNFIFFFLRPTEISTSTSSQESE